MIEENQMRPLVRYSGDKVDGRGYSLTMKELRGYDKINDSIYHNATVHGTIAYDKSISFIRCDFLALTLKDKPDPEYKRKPPKGCKNKDPPYVETVDFRDCKILHDSKRPEGIALRVFLGQSVFCHLLYLKLDNCEISNIENIMLCLQNIKNMKFIHFSNNKIRSIRTIIKYNSECCVYISNHLSYSSIEYDPRDYTNNFTGTLYDKKIYHHGGPTTDLTTTKKTTKKNRDHKEKLNNTEKTVMKNRDYKENLTSTERAVMKKDPQYSQKIYVAEQLEYVREREFNYIIDSGSFSRFKMKHWDYIPQNEQAKMRAQCGIRKLPKQPKEKTE